MPEIELKLTTAPNHLAELKESLEAMGSRSSASTTSLIVGCSLLHAMPSTARAVFSRAAFLLPIRRTTV
jgi:hypothetical protein